MIHEGKGEGLHLHQSQLVACRVAAKVVDFFVVLLLSKWIHGQQCSPYPLQQPTISMSQFLCANLAMLQFTSSTSFTTKKKKTGQ